MIWLIGTGPMAQAYYKVLVHLQVDTIIIGRSEAGCNSFKQHTDCRSRVVSGGIDSFLATSPQIPQHVIVAVDITALKSVTLSLLHYGAANILLEKPGGLFTSDIKQMQDCAALHNSNVLVGYNRRFFPSVLKARECIIHDGGVNTVMLDITEWSSRIDSLALPREVKNRWLIANTSHVFDTAFFLAGEPVSLTPHVKGGLSWHPSASVLAGTVNTESGALMVYHGDWACAGRWGIELTTAKRRLRLCPMESLEQQSKDELNWNVILLKSEGEGLKTGLLNQTKAFLNQDFADFCTLAVQRNRIAQLETMGSYSSNIGQ